MISNAFEALVLEVNFLGIQAVEKQNKESSKWMVKSLVVFCVFFGSNCKNVRDTHYMKTYQSEFFWLQKVGQRREILAILQIFKINRGLQMQTLTSIQKP